jgi:drug/metabolite transporter (DMT)-like permease
MNHVLRAMRPSTTSPLVLACLAATWLVWGSTYLAIKFALASFPPFFQMGTRFLVAGTLLMAWAWYRGQKMPTFTQWRNATVVGALMLGGNVGGVAYAEQTVASGLVVAFIAIVPALITVASLPFGIRPSRVEVIGMGLGIVGVLLLVRGDAFTASPAGLIAMTIAALGWSIGSVLSQHVLPLAPSSAGFSSQMICGGVVMMVLSLVAGESFHWPPQPLATAAWLYLVVFGSLIAFTAYMVLLSNTRAALAASYSFVNPVIAMLLGISLGAETVTNHEWVAVGIIVVGVTMVVVGRGATPQLQTDIECDMARPRAGPARRPQDAPLDVKGTGK